jgi:hypothetical protein
MTYVLIMVTVVENPIAALSLIELPCLTYGVQSSDRQLPLFQNVLPLQPFGVLVLQSS